MRANLSISLLLFSAACTEPAWHEKNAIDSGALDAVLKEFVEVKKTHPFLYARVERLNGDLLYEQAAVNPEFMGADSVNGNNWMRIWSMSKLVTTVLALDLIEDGTLRPEDPVSAYIPEFSDARVAIAPNGASLADLSDSTYGPEPLNPEAAAACPYQTVPAGSVMTVEHLLTHKAGFYYARTQIPCVDEPLAELSVGDASSSQDFIDRLAKLPLIQHPGTRYFYGLNTTVLGMVAERATGKSLKQLVKERIATPFDIEGLQYGLPRGAALAPRVSGADGALRLARDGELDIFGGSLPGYDPANELYLGGEGMVATAEGYARFLRIVLGYGALDGRRLLEAETVADMVSPKVQVDNDYGHGGYAVWVNSGLRSDGTYGRGGLWTGGGYETTRYWIDPKHQVVGVIMSQLFSVPPAGWAMEDEFREALDRSLTTGR